ncbi:hypothetical protein ALT_5484 [Aspergillus lentulus]|uniref:Rhodopsin domain-containing protein n=1 Tax=Aspergillus lentulus TaxID=293939 RepID=A0AAN4PL71_ASPLE|nr:hypothetical protein CNMCM8060_008934 [Aspergillus lentulus]KAF4192899.1 hypothetical protein CNMCM8694_009595 [Aspergillus lentulus]GAQ08163.1 hypothetical protein ALT_5484 [Aspergillus lentulus]GFF51447.1 hypothetical protein IFM62136_01791 [Aspergillus lentulus]GFF61575.1 hypothetical protein IFM60648_00325 [Aspergillus lentulus]
MGPYVPPGQSPPFQVVDDLHHGAWIIITAAFGLVVSLVCLLIRVYVRLALSPPFAYDDYVLLGATVVAIAQSTLIFVAVSQGFGTSINLLAQEQVNRIQTLVTISDILYLITIYVSKCCVVGIYLRLTPQKTHNQISWATLILCTLWIIPSALILAVNCEMNRPWKTSGGQCRNLLQRWEFITAMDIVTELILFALAVTLLQGLFMPLKRKLQIGSAFLFRLPLIMFTIFHIYTLKGHYHAPDPTLSVVTSKIWSQVELNYALVACSVFCLRPFMAAVSTNYGTAGDSNLKSSFGSSSRTPKDNSTGSGSKSRIGPLGGEERRTWRSRLWERRAAKDGRAGDLEKCLATGGIGTEDSTIAPLSPPIELVERKGLTSAGSDGTTKMIIRKDVQYSVEYKRKRPDSGVNPDAKYWDTYVTSES